MSTTETFLRGEGVSIDLKRADLDLTNLWGPAADRAGGPELDRPSVSRVVLTNLIVVGRVEALDAVMARFPCRALVLVADPSAESGRLQAESSAACHLPTPARPQICSERIALYAAPDSWSLFPGAVRSLLEPDLPTVLWWAEDVLAREDLYQTLAREATRAVIDRPDPGTPTEEFRRALNWSGQPFVHDRAWFGITPWRELLALQFEAKGAPAVESIRSLAVRALVPADSGVPRVAAWLAGWLGGQLGWDLPTPVGSEPGKATFHADGSGGPVAIELAWQVAAGLPTAQVQDVLIKCDGPMSIAATRARPDSAEVDLQTCRGDECTTRRTLLSAEFDPLGRILAALESSRHDPPARAATPHMLALSGVEHLS